MAFITLPSGRRIDTSHISYMKHTERTNSDGTVDVDRKLYMDNGDNFQIPDGDITALDTALNNQSTGSTNNVTVVNPDTNPVPVNTPAGSSISAVVDNPDTNPVPINAPNPIGVTGNLGVARGSNVWAGQLTTDADAVLGTAWNKTGLKSTTLVIHNTGANGATVTVQGSVDGTNWDSTILAATGVAAGAKNVQHISNYFTHIRILIRATTALSQTTVAARAAAIAT